MPLPNHFSFSLHTRLLTSKDYIARWNPCIHRTLVLYPLRFSGLFLQFRTVHNTVVAGEKFPHLDHYEYMGHFSVIAHALRTRSATVRSDERLCLATLLGLSLDNVVKASPEIRMEKFWSIQPSLGKNLILWEGPRLKTPGFRWAPASFLDNATQHQVFATATSTRQAHLTESGLLVQYPGYLLQEEFRLPFADSFRVHIKEKHYAHHVSLHPAMVPRSFGEAPNHSRIAILAVKERERATDLLPNYYAPVSGYVMFVHGI